MPPLEQHRKILGAILRARGVITDGQLAQAIDFQKKEPNLRIGEALEKIGVVKARDVAMALAVQFHMPFVTLAKVKVPRSVVQLIPETMARELQIMPLEKMNGTVTVAITDPLDLGTLDQIRFMLNTRVEGVIASPDDMREAIDRYYGVKEEKMDEMLKEMEEGGTTIEERRDEDPEGEVGHDDAPVVKLVTLLIRRALQVRASDVHVEPMENKLRIRYRVDGICFEVDPPPKRLQPSIIARIKIMAKMDIAEKRKPQDGRIKMILDNRQLDIRVSCLPAIHGESVVMRLLNKESISVGIQKLGFEDDDYKRFQGIIKRPNGIFLVTGPTGSGKSTTLYAALQELNRPDRKIITAENPVEYFVEGINQVEVKERIGLDFPRILRAMLRQAPEIILVGEIRDAETADIAINAALTGHLVFSTLHTNDAPSAITRLIDMGVKPFLVASALQAVMAQRLVRTNCSDCREPYAPEGVKLSALGLRPQDFQGRTFFRGKGCKKCQGKGYYGRLGIFELMEMSHTLREMAFHKTPAKGLRPQARLEGMRTLREDGARKVLAGVTTAEEVLSITMGD